MKKYKEFYEQASASRENLNEIVSAVLGLGYKLGKFGVKRGYKTAKWASGLPGARQALGGAAAGYSIAKGDPTGAALGAGMMLPGPLGLMATGANLVRSIRGDHRNNVSPTSTKPEEPKNPPKDPPKNPPKDPPKDTSSTGENKKSLEDMGREIARIQGEVQSRMDSGRIKNPFETPRTEPAPQIASAPSLKKRRDPRDRDINARGSYDPRYDRR